MGRNPLARLVGLFVLCVAVLAMLLLLPSAAQGQTPPDSVQRQVFVTWEPIGDSTRVATEARRWKARAVQVSPYGVMILRVYAIDWRPWVLDSLRSIRGVTGADLDAVEFAPPMGDDAELLASWGLDSMRVEGAWRQGVTGEGTVIGIPDTGFQWDHPEFSGRVIGCIRATGMQIDSVSPGVCAQDLAGCKHHGTHVASTAGGATRGVAPGSKLILVKTYANYGGCGNQPSDRINASRFLAARGVVVVNHSTGGSGFGAEMFAAQDARAAGIAWCASAGNGGTNYQYAVAPASFAAVFGIGALEPSLAKASYSQANAGVVDFAFPGSSISGAMGGTSYGAKSGTSMASPHCAGLIALLRQVLPTVSVDSLYSIMQACSTDLSTPGRDNGTGWGFPRADRCVAMARGVSTQPVTWSPDVVITGPYPVSGCVDVVSPVAWRTTAPPSWLTLTTTHDRLCYRIDSDPGHVSATISLIEVP